MRTYNVGDRVQYFKSERGTVVRKLPTQHGRESYVIRFDDGVETECDEAYLSKEATTCILKT